MKGEQLEVTIDGERVKLFDWDKEISNTTGNGRSTPRIPVKAGLHTVGVTFIATNDVPGSELNRPFQRTMNTPGSIPGFQFYPHVGQVWIEGPYSAKGATDTSTARRFLFAGPPLPQETGSCARTIITTLVKHALPPPGHAFRHEQSDGVLSGRPRPMAATSTTASKRRCRGSWQIRNLCIAWKRNRQVSPSAKRIAFSDLALASRLSFFLWSSVPDDELIDLAAQGKLKDPAVLEQQVRRMLADPKSDALIENFTGQWLNVRSLQDQRSGGESVSGFRR